MTTELTGQQPKLHQIFGLAKGTEELGHTPKPAPAPR